MSGTGQGELKHHLWPPPPRPSSAARCKCEQSGERSGPPSVGSPHPSMLHPHQRLLERVQVMWFKPGVPGPVGFLALSNMESLHLEGTDSRQASKESPEGEREDCGEGQAGLGPLPGKSGTKPGWAQSPPRDPCDEFHPNLRRLC